MLSPNELNLLYNVISDENKTFENLAANFQKSFPKSDQFKVGVTLWFLLKDNLLNLSQRLASFYLLYEMYRLEKVSTTPFVPIVLETLQTSKNNVEKKLLMEFIEVSVKVNTPKLTVRQFIDENKGLETLVLPDLKQYWNIHNKEREKLNDMINDWIRPVIYDRDEIQRNKNIENMPVFNFSHLTPEETSFNYFEPNYLTIYPNSTYPFYEDEPIWIMPTLKYDFLWDFTMSPEQDAVASILNKPLNNKVITEEQMKYVLDLLSENPNILAEIQFTPDNLMQLIEKNPNFAAEILLKISKNIIFEDYLSPFITKSWSVLTMQVLNKIIQKVDLPKEFIDSYIKHCIASYKQETKKDYKIRHARIIAIFVTNLIEHEHFYFDTIPHEVIIEKIKIFFKKLEELCIENKKLEEITILTQKLNLPGEKKIKPN